MWSRETLLDVLLGLLSDGLLSNLRGISGLNLDLDADELLLDRVLGGGVHHLRFDGGRVRGPEDEGDLVPLPSVNLELVVENGVAAVPLGELGLELIVGGVGSADLIYDYLSVVGVHLEGDIAVLVAELELVELSDTVVGHSNA